MKDETMLKKQLQKIALTSPDLVSYQKSISLFLKKEILFSSICFHLIDSETLLTRQATTDKKIQAIHPQLMSYEYLDESVHTYRQMLKTQTYISILSQLEHPILIENKKFTDILAPATIADEMRIALIYQGICWGFLTLFKSTDDGFFTKSESDLVMYIAPFIAAYLGKSTQVKLTSQPLGNQDFASFIMLNKELEIVGYTQSGKSWLHRLQVELQLSSIQIPIPLQNLATRLFFSKEPSEKLLLSLDNGELVSVVASLYVTSSDSPKIQQVSITFQEPSLSEKNQLSNATKAVNCSRAKSCRLYFIWSKQ
ncbi:LuxR family transcriptional regulator [Carnobacterium maltaromaticum]|uniref:LuxR family transcriptional regulator n=1 Tax=Carnobacterium maltaromaticum TaxID=2751 RepID=UPI002152B893|nr:LuxR family transcriptional regulator [Carnobacterium maltaromaticum]